MMKLHFFVLCYKSPAENRNGGRGGGGGGVRRPYAPLTVSLFDLKYEYEMLSFGELHVYTPKFFGIMVISYYNLVCVYRSLSV